MFARLSFLILCAALLVASITPLAAQENMPRVQAVRFGQHPGYFRIVLDLSSPMVCTPDASSNTELVLTCPPLRWGAGKVQPPVSSLLSSFAPRHGKDGTAELVGIGLQEVGLTKVFSVPSRDGAPPRLVIDYRRGAAASGIALQDTPEPPSDFETMVANLSQNQRADAGAPVLPQPKPVKGSWVAGDADGQGMDVPDASMRTEPFIIVLDPGHGGVDPGAKSVNGGHEKDIVLAIARELRKLLAADPRYKVHMTRDSDVFIKLGDRVKIGRKHKADLFISLHADSLPSKRAAKGASFYTISQTASDEQTAKLAERENKADMLGGINIEHEDKMVENILLDLITRDTVNHSKFFANTLTETYRRKNMDTLKPAHRSAGFAVLKAADIPSVLIEMGFLTNPAEADRLMDLDYRRRIAATIKAAIDAYVAGSEGGF